MKIALAIIMCSYAYGECMDPYVFPQRYASHYECMIDGYQKSLDKMKEILNDKNIIYYCKQINNYWYFHRITTKTTKEDLINVETIENPFIQIELEQNETKIDISEKLKYFYTKNNTILDNMFLKWFLYYYYDKKLLDTYKLHIIDKDANIITMDSCDDEICNKIIL